VQPLGSDHEPLVGGVIAPETVWSCMQCMACVEACPVGIEHVPIINNLRRPLFESGDIEPRLQAAMERIQSTGNSFGESRRRRGGWTRDLEFEIKDIRRQPAELLWFLGDYASFDPRNQRVTRALARILRGAGVDFGILFDTESTAGCDVRRAGEESLWTSLAEQNIATIKQCRFDRIMSTDPHTYHTLKNEYPSLGGSWTVVHHTELLSELVQGGRLNFVSKLPRRVTYHDPCMLGRYNSVYEAPRELIRSVGADLIEMPRNRSNSFCCGAGGGRIWMQDIGKTGQTRPSEQRIAEAVGLGGIEYFVVACPKDVTMYEDAIKTSGNEERIELREVTELVAAAIGEG
jgi:Fe-S oxidoreductase